MRRLARQTEIDPLFLSIPAVFRMVSELGRVVKEIGGVKFFIRLEGEMVARPPVDRRAEAGARQRPEILVRRDGRLEVGQLELEAAAREIYREAVEMPAFPR